MLSLLEINSNFNKFISNHTQNNMMFTSSNLRAFNKYNHEEQSWMPPVLPLTF